MSNFLIGMAILASEVLLGYLAVRAIKKEKNRQKEEKQISDKPKE